MRALVTILSLPLLVSCSPPVHVLADEEDRPLRVYDDALSCQFSAVWHRERGVEASCHSMSESKLQLFNLREVIRE